MKDVLGNNIEVGDLVAYAMFAGSSAGVLAVGHVLKLPVGNGKLHMRELKPNPYNGKYIDRYVNAKPERIVRLA